VGTLNDKVNVSTVVIKLAFSGCRVCGGVARVMLNYASEAGDSYADY